MVSRDAIDGSTIPTYGTNASPPSSLNGTTIDDSITQSGGSDDGPPIECSDDPDVPCQPATGDELDEVSSDPSTDCDDDGDDDDDSSTGGELDESDPPTDCDGDEDDPSQSSTGDVDDPSQPSTGDPNDGLSDPPTDSSFSSSSSNVYTQSSTGMTPNSQTTNSPYSQQTNLPGTFSGLGNPPDNSSNPLIDLKLTDQDYVELLDALRILFNLGNEAGPSSVDNNDQFESFLQFINSTSTATTPAGQTFSPGSVLRRYRAEQSNAHNAKSKRVQPWWKSKRANVLSGRVKFKSRHAEEFGPLAVREDVPRSAAAWPSRRRAISKPSTAKR